MKNNKILITGTAGFLGGSLAYELLKKSFNVVGIDNYSNSDGSNTKKLEKYFGSSFKFYELDLSNELSLMKKVFLEEQPEAVIHFAAKKSTIGSKKAPLQYWKNNLNSTINVIDAMESIGCKKLIYSSSAAVYGESESPPANELDHLFPMTPYSSTKMASEMFIKDLCQNGDIKAIILRYFNPVCSHLDQVITENLSQEDSTLMQEIIKTALGKNKILKIFGSDFDTKDGTCERDFIHTQDVLDAHYVSMSNFQNFEKSLTLNVGTGISVSVLELIKAFEKNNKIKINYEFCKKREGEISKSYADISFINKKFGWAAKKNIKDMVIDAWTPFKNEIN